MKELLHDDDVREEGREKAEKKEGWKEEKRVKASW